MKQNIDKVLNYLQDCSKGLTYYETTLDKVKIQIIKQEMAFDEAISYIAQNN